jgi:hypothetical protein
MSLTAGSIQFTFFNADGNDGLSFVAIDNIPGGTSITFNDNEWNGSAPNAGGAFNTGEGSFTWTAPSAGVTAGTEVKLTDISSATLKAASVGSLGTGTMALGNSEESVYAFTGSGASTTFLSAISNNNFSNSATGTLAGTGLTAGTNAVGLTNNVDVALYNGSTSFGTDRSAALTSISTTTPATGTQDKTTAATQGNWVTQGGGNAQDADGTSPDGSYAARTFTICFLPGTAIATPDGLRAVETLAMGDRIVTADGRDIAVKWVGRQTLVTAFRMPEGRRPVAIAAGALGPNVPARMLRVTADHALLLDGVLVNAGALVNGTTIRRLTDAELGARCTVFHIETEDHDIILAEGTPSETFLDTVTRARFDNFAEWQALYGAEPETMVELDLPRALSARQVPPALRARIAAIAAGRVAAAA